MSVQEQDDDKYVDIFERAEHKCYIRAAVVCGSIAVLMTLFATTSGKIGPVLTFGVAGLCIGYMAGSTIIFFRLFERPIGFDCTHCGKRLSTEFTWLCGYCDARNDPHEVLGTPSLAVRCGGPVCKKRPLSYLCDFCGQCIYLSDDYDGRHPALAVETKEKIDQDKQNGSVNEGHDPWADKIEEDMEEFEGSIRYEQELFKRLEHEIIKLNGDPTLGEEARKRLIDRHRRWVNAKLQAIKQI